MARAFSWGGTRPRRRGEPGEPRPSEEGRATAARPSSRSYAQGLRSEASPKKWGSARNLLVACSTPPAAGNKVRGCALRPAQAGSPPATRGGRRAVSRFLRSQLRRIGLGHPRQARPRRGQTWSTAEPCSDQRCSRGLRSGHRRPRPPPSPPRGASPKEELGIPRRLADRCCGQTAAAILDVPALGRDPSRIGFRLRQGGKASRARLLFYVTQRSPFRLPR